LGARPTEKQKQKQNKKQTKNKKQKKNSRMCGAHTYSLHASRGIVRSIKLNPRKKRKREKIGIPTPTTLHHHGVFTIRLNLA
jgi:hypothetical protein